MIKIDTSSCGFLTRIYYRFDIQVATLHKRLKPISKRTFSIAELYCRSCLIRHMNTDIRSLGISVADTMDKDVQKNTLINDIVYLIQVYEL